MALLGLGLFLVACASKPAPELVSDPDAQRGSAIPWNKPASWEGQANVPGGGFSSNPTFGSETR